MSNSDKQAALVRERARLTARRKELEAQLADVKKQLSEVDAAILAEMNVSDVTAWETPIGRVSKVERVFPVVEAGKWDELEDWMIDSGHIILQHRLSSRAINDLRDLGVEVPFIADKREFHIRFTSRKGDNNG